jgi:hypothetical protein
MEIPVNVSTATFRHYSIVALPIVFYSVLYIKTTVITPCSASTAITTR